MCGIFGVMAAHTCTKSQEEFVFDAFNAGQVRGLHGTGLFTVDGRGYVRNVALAVPGTTFLGDPRAQDVYKSIPQSRVIVGHNRYTTSGTDKDDHCHPFRYEHLVGVHNGGFSEAALLTIDPKRSHEVDSARVYAALNAAKNPLDVLEQIDQGAYCLVWYDGRKRSLFMARNHQRPLFVSETPSGVYFASELGMLSWLMGRNNVTTLREVPIASLNPTTLYEIPLDDPSQISATPYEPVIPIKPRSHYSGLYTGTFLPAPYPYNTPQHRYYQGVGIYGPTPSPVAYKRYHLIDTLVKDFPCFTKLADEIESLEIPEHMMATVPFVLLGTGVDVQGEKCAYGVMSVPKGDRQFMNVLISCRLITEGDELLMKRLLELSSEDTKDGVSYPIIPVQYNAILVRPTGELILMGSLPFSFSEDDIPDLYWVYGIDKTAPAWVERWVSSECLTQLLPDQLTASWSDLRSGKTKVTTDDFPF